MIHLASKINYKALEMLFRGGFWGVSGPSWRHFWRSGRHLGCLVAPLGSKVAKIHRQSTHLSQFGAILGAKLEAKIEEIWIEKSLIFHTFFESLAKAKIMRKWVPNRAQNGAKSGFGMACKRKRRMCDLERQYTVFAIF